MPCMRTGKAANTNRRTQEYAQVSTSSFGDQLPNEALACRYCWPLPCVMRQASQEDKCLHRCAHTQVSCKLRFTATPGRCRKQKRNVGKEDNHSHNDVQKEADGGFVGARERKGFDSEQAALSIKRTTPNTFLEHDHSPIDCN